MSGSATSNRDGTSGNGGAGSGSGDGSGGGSGKACSSESGAPSAAAPEPAGEGEAADGGEADTTNADGEAGAVADGAAAGATGDLWTRLTGEAVPVTEAAPKEEDEGVKEVNEEELLSSVHSRLKEKRKALLKESGTKTLAQSVSNVDIAHRPSSCSLATPAAFEHLNKVLLSKSANSSLVLMNLPNLWGLSEQDCLSYVAYCDCLTQGLERVIFAHGAGNEIFSLF